MRYRRKDWRSRLFAWAAAVRYRPYVWGETDCVSLIRAALTAQFGEEPFPAQAVPRTLKEAITLYQETPFEGLFLRRGAEKLTRRVRDQWPLGAILVLREDGGIPAFGVYVDPFVVQSEQGIGVQWASPQGLSRQVESAWLFQEVHDG